MLSRIRKKDQVIVITGRDKGKQGQIIGIVPKKEKVLVKGIAMVTKHAKARRQDEKSGIRKQESYLPFGNVMLICPSCKKPCRVQTKTLENKKKMRACHRCEGTF